MLDPEEIVEAVEKAVRELLQREKIEEPPVDVLELAQRRFGFRLEFVHPEEVEERKYGDRPKPRPNPFSIVLRVDQSEESQHMLAARAIAGRLLPELLPKLGIPAGTESRQGRSQLIVMLTANLLLPTRWFASDARKAGWDLIALKERYTNVGFELLTRRMLDVAEDPVVWSIVDDGVVAFRKGNRFQVARKLFPAEQQCLEKVEQTDQPARVRSEEWSAWGWPTPGIPFRRIILRAVPEEI